jgi:hypothetical protein
MMPRRLLVLATVPPTIIERFLAQVFTSDCELHLVIRADMLPGLTLPIGALCHCFDDHLNRKTVRDIRGRAPGAFDQIVMLKNITIPRPTLRFHDYYHRTDAYANVEQVALALGGWRASYTVIDREMRRVPIPYHFLRLKRWLHPFDKGLLLPMARRLASLVFKLLPRVLPRGDGVVHLPFDIAFVPSTLVHGLNQRGYPAFLLNLYRHPLVDTPGWFFDRSLLHSVRFMRKVVAFIYCMFRFRIFHYHFNALVFNEFDELTLLRRSGKLIVAHYHGCDVRRPSKLRGRERFSVCGECHIDCREAERVERGRRFISAAHLQLCALPDIIDQAPGAKLLLNPLGPAMTGKIRSRQSRDEIVIVHAPSNRPLKGTAHVIEAVSRLREAGHRLRLEIVEHRSHATAMKVYDTADLAIDQLVHGWYGVFALEMLSRGIMVLSYIRADLARGLEDCPMVNVNPDTLHARLETILVHRQYLDADLPRRSAAYLARYHSLESCAARLQEMYEAIGNPDSGEKRDPATT